MQPVEYYDSTLILSQLITWPGSYWAKMLIFTHTNSWKIFRDLIARDHSRIVDIHGNRAVGAPVSPQPPPPETPLSLPVMKRECSYVDPGGTIHFTTRRVCLASSASSAEPQHRGHTAQGAPVGRWAGPSPPSQLWHARPPNFYMLNTLILTGSGSYHFFVFKKHCISFCMFY